MLIRAYRNTVQACNFCCNSGKWHSTTTNSPTANSSIKKTSKKRASSQDALFVCLLFCFIVAGSPTLAAQTEQTNCAVGTVAETVTVSQVIDGDTLRLRDGRLVRLIGINTPEIGREGRPSEPLAKAARKALQTLLGKTTTVGLRFDREKQDRYGRLLAHVYLSDGTNIEVALLTAGLAAQIVVPPNVMQLECYQAAENNARKAGKGVWQNVYRPVPVKEVSHNARGFRIIRGRVLQVGESRRSVWLNFQPRPSEGPREGVAVRIARTDLEWFGDRQLHSLRGKNIIVRGWLSPYKKQLVMRLRHPASMEIVP